MDAPKVRRRRGPRNGAVSYPRPEDTPNHRGPAIVPAFAAADRCGEQAAKKRLETWRDTTRTLTAIIRQHPEHRQWFARCLMDAVAAVVEPTDGLHALALRYSAEDADTAPELLAYLTDPTPGRLATLRREMRQERLANAELDAALALQEAR